MSWTLSASGKAAEVRKSVADQFEAIDYLKSPEAEIKSRVAAAVNMALQAYPDDKNVAVTCYGSQSVIEDSTTAINSLSIKIEPQP